VSDHEIAGGHIPPAPGTWPAVGTVVTVSSTRRDKDGEGPVLAINMHGVRIRRTEDSRDRFYPWGQIAFIEWFDEAPVAAEEKVTTAARTDALALWQFVPLGELDPATPVIEVPTWWAEEMKTAGFPVESYVKREAQHRDIIEGEAAWGEGGETLGDMLAASVVAVEDEEPGKELQDVIMRGLGEDENVPDDLLQTFLHPVDSAPEPTRKGRMLMSPEVRGWRVPAMLAACGNPTLALWAARVHTPGELGTLYALHEGNFAAFMRELCDGEARDPARGRG
jgi:hypothetical protein